MSRFFLKQMIIVISSSRSLLAWPPESREMNFSSLSSGIYSPTKILDWFFHLSSSIRLSLRTLCVDATTSNRRRLNLSKFFLYIVNLLYWTHVQSCRAQLHTTSSQQSTERWFKLTLCISHLLAILTIKLTRIRSLVDDVGQFVKWLREENISFKCSREDCANF